MLWNDDTLNAQNTQSNEYLMNCAGVIMQRAFSSCIQNWIAPALLTGGREVEDKTTNTKFLQRAYEIYKHWNDKSWTGVSLKTAERK